MHCFSGEKQPKNLYGNEYCKILWKSAKSELLANFKTLKTPFFEKNFQTLENFLKN